MKKKSIIIGLVIAIVIITIVVILILNNKSKNAILDNDEYGFDTRIFSILTIDINPSIMINLNKDNIVVSVISLNEDSKNLLDDIDFNGKTLDDTIKTIITLLMNNDYIKSDEDTILINLKTEDKSLSKKVSDSIYKVTDEQDIVLNLVMLDIEETDDLKKIAEDYGITTGKAYYITEQIKDQDNITFEELSSAPINEIKNIVDTKIKEQEKIKEDNKKTTSTSKNNSTSSNDTSESYTCTPPSDIKSTMWCSWNVKRPQNCEYSYPERKDYTVINDAINKALGLSGADINGAIGTRITYSGASYCEATKKEILKDDYKYTVIIDNVSLEILSSTKEQINNIVMSEDDAKRKALAHFSLNEDDCENCYVIKDMNGSSSGGYIRYQVNMFMKDGKNYSVDFNASTGALENSRTW